MREKLHITEDLTFKIKSVVRLFSSQEREISWGGEWRGGKVNTKRIKCCPIAHSWRLRPVEGWQELDQINYIPEICRKPQGTTESLKRSFFDIVFCMDGEQLSSGAEDIIHLGYVKCSQQKAGKATTHWEGGTSAMVKSFTLNLLLSLRP